MLKRYRRFKPFTEAEAWMLFKLAAVGEAIGWTLLITGILLAHFLHSGLPVLIAGQFHGILFLIYMAAAVLVSPSLGWRSEKIMLAAACGVPPYGSLAFELYQARLVRRSGLRLLVYRQRLMRLASSGLTRN